MIKKFYWVIFAIVFVFIFFQPVFTVVKDSSDLFARGYSQNYANFKRVYYASQYVTKVKPAIIPDETLEAFAGGAFLHGLNPILIIHDQPPLGRYLTALSIYLFDNANTMDILLLWCSVLGIYLLAKEVLTDAILALIPVGIFVNEKLFIDKFSYAPLLEPIQLPFIVFTLYFFIKGVKSNHYKWYFFLTALMLGAVISIRFFILGVVLLIALGIFLVYKRMFNKKSLWFVLLLPVSLIVLILSYTKTIMSGYSVLHVFGIQKYIFVYHKSALILPFSFWDLIFLNRWHTWWGDRSILHDVNWNFFWPITAGLSILSGLFFVFGLYKRFIAKTNISKAVQQITALSDSEIILLLWAFGYALFLSVGYTSTRYFLPLLPFFYILAVSFTVKLLRLKLKPPSGIKRINRSKR